MMMTPENARLAANRLDIALDQVQKLGELPFANMQRQAEKLESTLGQMAIELRMYAQNKDERL